MKKLLRRTLAALGALSMIFALSLSLSLPEEAKAVETYCPGGSHVYGKMTRTPSEDYSTCTATRKCANCPMTQTSTGAHCNTHVLHNVSCDKDGKAQYFYSFSDSWVIEAWKEEDSAHTGDVWITVTTPKLGHLFTQYVRDEGANTLTAHCDREGCNATDTISDTFILPEYYPEEAAEEEIEKAETEAAVAPKTGEAGEMSLLLAALSLGALMLALKERAKA